MFLDIGDYPTCIQQLGAAARASAIDIFDTLLSIGVEEGKTLRIALATAHHMDVDVATPMLDDDY